MYALIHSFRYICYLFVNYYLFFFTLQTLFVIMSYGEPEEPILVKLRSKSISNKEKAALYKIVCDHLVKRGYEIRSPKGIKRMWNMLFSEYIKAKDIIKNKSGVKAMKSSPWVITIADGMKRFEIEADLDEMVLDSLDSLDLNVTCRYACCPVFLLLANLDH